MPADMPALPITGRGLAARLRGRLLGIFGTILMVILGVTLRGEWILILVHFLGPQSNKPRLLDLSNMTSESLSPEYTDGLNSFLVLYNLQNVHWLMALSVMVSLVSFFSLGGWLQWYFYIRQKDAPENWKCQPNRFLTPENERHEVMMGATNMVIGGVVSGAVAAWILNGGFCTLYFNMTEYGWSYLIISTVALFFIQDGTAYYLHRLNHTPWVYKRIHKHHHRYHSPTAFSATAMHPVEFLEFELALGVPAFFLPCYSGSFILLMIYSYYYGMIDHSGIKMDAIWPWQPPTLFHDNHHRLFHCNFGFNMKLWDWLHDTLDKKDRMYGENIFGGKGKQRVQSTKKIKSG